MANDTEQTEYMLTTVDNPFDPFTQWDEWFAYDYKMGYDTPAFLARVAWVSEDQSEPDQAVALDQAMDYIIQENVSGMWRKIARNSSLIPEP